MNIVSFRSTESRIGRSWLIIKPSHIFYIFEIRIGATHSIRPQRLFLFIASFRKPCRLAVYVCVNVFWTQSCEMFIRQFVYGVNIFICMKQNIQRVLCYSYYYITVVALPFERLLHVIHGVYQTHFRHPQTIKCIRLIKCCVFINWCIFFLSDFFYKRFSFNVTIARISFWIWFIFGSTKSLFFCTNFVFLLL